MRNTIPTMEKKPFVTIRHIGQRISEKGVETIVRIEGKTQEDMDAAKKVLESIGMVHDAEGKLISERPKPNWASPENPAKN